jgi:iron-sulfur cluster repair protein YtfE (RIC family)
MNNRKKPRVLTLRTMTGNMNMNTATGGTGHLSLQKTTIDSTGKPVGNFLYWPLEVLTGHIRSGQERLIRSSLPDIEALFTTVCGLHRKFHPEITAVHDLYREAARELERITELDRASIFPYIIQLAQCHHDNSEVTVPPFSSLSQILGQSRAAYAENCRTLETVIDMTFTFNKFTSVNSAHNALVQSLNALDDDLHSLAHLKFGILFSRAIEMEKTVARAACPQPTYLI